MAGLHRSWWFSAMRGRQGGADRSDLQKNGFITEIVIRIIFSRQDTSVTLAGKAMLDHRHEKDGSHWSSGANLCMGCPMKSLLKQIGRASCRERVSITVV